MKPERRGCGGYQASIAPAPKNHRAKLGLEKCTDEKKKIAIGSESSELQENKVGWVREQPQHAQYKETGARKRVARHGKRGDKTEAAPPATTHESEIASDPGCRHSGQSCNTRGNGFFPLQ